MCRDQVYVKKQKAKITRKVQVHCYTQILANGRFKPLLILTFNVLKNNNKKDRQLYPPVVVSSLPAQVGATPSQRSQWPIVLCTIWCAERAGSQQAGQRMDAKGKACINPRDDAFGMKLAYILYYWSEGFKWLVLHGRKWVVRNYLERWGTRLLVSSWQTGTTDLHVSCQEN